MTNGSFVGLLASLRWLHIALLGLSYQKMTVWVCHLLFKATSNASRQDTSQSLAGAYYSADAFSELWQLISAMLEFCTDPEVHHSVIYSKYTLKYDFIIRPIGNFAILKGLKRPSQILVSSSPSRSWETALQCNVLFNVFYMSDTVGNVICDNRLNAVNRHNHISSAYATRAALWWRILPWCVSSVLCNESWIANFWSRSPCQLMTAST